MRAVAMCASALLRKNGWGSVALVLLVGVAGGAVLAALAGARRTDGAYPRLLAATHAADLSIGTQGFGVVPVAEIAKLPGAELVARLIALGVARRPKDGSPPKNYGDVFAAASADGVAGYRVERLQLLEGRRPRRDSLHEVLVNEIATNRLGLKVGDVFPADVFSFQELLAAGDQPSPSELAKLFTPIDLKVVGVGRARTDLLVNANQDQAGMMLSPRFARHFASKVSFEGAQVVLRGHDRGIPSFEAEVRKRFPDLNLDFASSKRDAATFAQVTNPYVDALNLFALVAAVTGLLVVGQALVRVVATDSRDGDDLAALGTTRAQRTVVAGTRAAAIVVAGALVAVLAAYLASPIFPLGRARLAEPSGGLEADALVLGAGLVGVVVLLLVPVALVGWRRARRMAGSVAESAWRPSRLVERLAQAGAAASVVNGVRFAVQRERGAADAPLATALFGLVAAIATIGASLVFATNLDALVSRPSHYGWSWDALVDTYDVGASQDFVTRVRADHDFTAVTTGSRAVIAIDRATVPAYGFNVLRGRALPAVTDGRWPSAPDEIALGAQTMRDLSKSIGDTVTGNTPAGGAVRLRIVGRTALPSLSLNGTYGLGEGAALTARGLKVFDPAANPSFLLVNLAPGVRIATMNRRYSDIASVLGPQRPADIQSYDAVRATPLLLAALLAVLSVGVLSHLLVTSVRRRRRDIAVLKTFGFARRQVRATVACQATTVVVVALMIGVPLGIIVGRWIWKGFASHLGVTEAVDIPTLALVVVAVGAAILANLIAALPARTAARTKPALVLRTE